MASQLNALQAAIVKQIDIAGNFVLIPKNKAIIDKYPPFKEECDDYSVNLTLLKSLIPQKDYEAITGIISTNTSLKQEIANDLEAIAHTTLAYCFKENNTTLAASFHFNQWDIIKLKQEDISPTITRVSKLLTPLLEDPIFIKYEITDVTLSDLTAKGLAYDNSIGTTGTSENEVSAANTSIDKISKTMLQQLRLMRLLNTRNKNIQPEFYSAFIKNTRTQHPATRSTGLQGHVLDKNGKGIMGTTVILVGTNLSAITDADGYYSILKLSIGTYTLQAINGIAVLTHEVVVSYRHVETQDFIFN